MSTYRQVVIPVFPLTPYPPASSYQLFSYLAGTVNTKQATWVDQGGVTQNTNPMIIQSGSGTPTYITIFCQVGVSYKFVLTSSTDTDPPTSPFWTVDNLPTADNLDLTPYVSVANGKITVVNSILTKPQIAEIDDTNGNAELTFTTTASAVNSVNITNAATGNNAKISAAGEINRGLILADSNGNAVITTASTASAVNSIKVTNTATGNAPKIGPIGESNKGLIITDSNGNTIITGASTASAVNSYTVTNQATGVSPTIQMVGDSNRNARLLGAGTGGVNIGSPSGTTPLILEPGSSTNTVSLSVPSITAARTLTFPDNNVNLTNGAFYAYATTGASLAGTATTKVVFNAKLYDVNGWFDNVTNYRYTPLVAGKYFITSTYTGSYNSGGSLASIYIKIRKTGSDYSNGQIIITSVSGVLSPVNVTVSAVVDMNGTTDYIEIFGVTSGTGTVSQASTTQEGIFVCGYHIPS